MVLSRQRVEFISEIVKFKEKQLYDYDGGWAIVASQFLLIQKEGDLWRGERSHGRRTPLVEGQEEEEPHSLILRHWWCVLYFGRCCDFVNVQEEEEEVNGDAIRTVAFD